MSKLDNVASQLAQTVARRKLTEAEIKAVYEKFADRITEAEEALAKIRAKANKAAGPLLETKDDLVHDESTLRAQLMKDAPIGASWQTLHGTVSVQSVPDYVVTRFASVPNDFRLPPEKCINKAAVKKAFKDGGKVPGIRADEKPSVVVR